MANILLDFGTFLFFENQAPVSEYSFFMQMWKWHNKWLLSTSAKNHQKLEPKVVWWVKINISLFQLDNSLGLGLYPSEKKKIKKLYLWLLHFHLTVHSKKKITNQYNTQIFHRKHFFIWPWLWFLSFFKKKNWLRLTKS